MPEQGSTVTREGDYLEDSPVEQGSPAEPEIHLQSYLRFRDLLEAAPDAIFEVDRDGTIVLLNAAAERIFGYPREELLGRFIEVLVPAARRERHREHRDHYSQHPATRPMGIGLELFAVRKDQTEFPVEISLSPIRSTRGSRVIAVVRDITARKQAEAQINLLHQQFTAELAATNQQLELRNREVERANRLKSEFLASMSHELRTPLHTIIGFADLLAEELKGPLTPDQKRFIAHIQRDSRHLLELINDILDLSKIEAGRLELHPDLFRSADAIAETISGLQPVAAAKHIEVVQNLAADLEINADRIRFKEVLYNLLSNALKFTPDGGRVVVESRRTATGAEFSVTDTGIGIPESEKTAIFDKFYQLGSTTRGIREGTGLGLAITKSLIELHGGTIRVDSKVNAGSRFEFAIPMAVEEAEKPRELPPTADSIRPVLLVMNEGESSRRLTESLNSFGYRVIPVSTAEEAIKESRATRPLAILLDLPALGEQGWRLFEAVREVANRRVPVFALALEEDTNTAVSLGATAVLVKPVMPEALIRTLQEQIPHIPGQPSRVLVVDDDPKARELLDETLRSVGLLSVLASGGKQALEFLARGPIAAVVVDLMMPEMSGFELILRIRQKPEFLRLPVIVLTAKEIDRDDLQILSRQTNAIFLKGSPWREGFVAEIRNLLQDVTKNEADPGCGR